MNVMTFNFKKITSVTALSLSVTCATFFTVSTHAQTQTIKKSSDQQIIKGSDQYFIGTVVIKPLTAVTQGINTPSAYVSFNNNARSFWHTHPKGQYLVVTQGEGLVQEWGKPAEKIAVGDIVYCPPNIKHWHGARNTTAMTHLALTGTDEQGKNVDWLEPVSNEQYEVANL